MIAQMLPCDQDQRDAAIATFDRNVFLAAGAGSGKTKILVGRYLRILEESRAEVPEIIAITFTEKAAREMKDRVRVECVTTLTGCDSVEERRKWERHQRDLENAPISTIHALCTRVLRENPVAAGIDPEFQVLDETQKSILLREHVEGFVLERLSEEGQRSERASEEDTENGLRLLAANFGVRSLLDIFLRALSDSELCEQWVVNETNVDQLEGRWLKQQQDSMQEQLAALLESPELKQAVEVVLHTEPVDPADKLAVIRQSVVGLLPRLINCRVVDAEALEAAAQVARMPAPGAVGSKSKWPSRESLESVKAALRQVRETFSDFKELGESSDLTRLSAQHTVALLGELRVAYQQFQQLKRSRSLLDFDDLQLLTAGLLKNHASIRLRCRDRFKHVLVDEFQDTNSLQKQIAWILAGSDDGEEEGLPGRLFVVGDAKQSIYRFRGADVSVFNTTRRQFGESNGCQVLALQTNFRSQGPLLDFLNEIFSKDCLMGEGFDRPAYEAFYEPLEEAPNRPSTMEPPARLSVVRSWVQQEEPPEDTPNTLDGLRELEGHFTARTIKDLVASHKVILDKDNRTLRPVEYGDIALLFRSMLGLSHYERGLRLAEIPYHLESGRGLYQKLEILDMLSVLKHLELPEDSYSLACVLRSPCVGVSDATLYWLSQGEGLVRNYDAIFARAQSVECEPLCRIKRDEIEKLQFSHEVFKRLRWKKDRVSIAEILGEILEATGLAAVLLTQFNGERAVANVRKLIDLARDFERTGLFSVHDFIKHLDQFSIVEERESEAAVHEEEDNVVKIMTIHKAKGLEWPVVILPDLMRGPLHSSELPVLLSREFGLASKVYGPDGKAVYPGPVNWMRSEEQKREYAERRRLLYVAMTRAKDHLLMSSVVRVKPSDADNTGKPGKAGNSWLDWLTEALGVEVEHNVSKSGTELCAVDYLEVGDIEIFRHHGSPHNSLSRQLASAFHAASPTESDAPVDELRRRIQPILPDPSLRRTTSVAQLRELAACPYRFYLARVAGLTEVSEVDLQGAEEPRRTMGNVAATPSLTPRSLSAAQRGTLVHRLLQAVSLDAGASDDSLIGSALLSQDLSPESVPETARADLLRIVQQFRSGTIAEWCGSVQRQRCEYPFSFLMDGMLVDGTLDWIGGDMARWTHLLDYKTGAMPDADHISDYQFQLGLYCCALECSGHLPEKAALYFVDQDGLLVPFDVAEIAQAAQSLAAQILSQIRSKDYAPRPADHCRLCPQLWACDAGKRLHSA